VARFLGDEVLMLFISQARGKALTLTFPPAREKQTNPDRRCWSKATIPSCETFGVTMLKPYYAKMSDDEWNTMTAHQQQAFRKAFKAATQKRRQCPTCHGDGFVIVNEAERE
jgi:hypothetical protein